MNAGRHERPEARGGANIVEVAALFDGRRTFRAAIDAVLEGRCGAIASGRDCARLDLGPFSLLAGDETSEDAPALVAGAPKPRIFVDAAPWHGAIRRQHEAGRFELVPRIGFSPDALDADVLQALRRVAPGLRIVPLDAAWLREAVVRLSGDLLIDAVFRDAEAFVSGGGFGFAVVEGDRVLSAATSAIVSEHHIEVQINTAPAQRQHGLATAVGAAIALEAKARGLEPGWDTASAASAALAQKLGYRAAREYEWLCVDPPA